ncbi:hypothetical protein N752_18730 [Desulforamulus aquiferis]|nr:DUF3788 family protein [Desulforamulus aquiferis]RYD03610.1 hypothetical protein N752_18730 [Desulforamulus aquiferis]
MTEIDLILDASFTPTYEDICCYMNKAVQEGWQEMNAFIQQSYKASPKLAYSKCSAKPGWNIKYKKQANLFVPYIQKKMALSHW